MTAGSVTIGGDESRRSGVEFVSAHYFSELGAAPLAGRLLDPAQDSALFYHNALRATDGSNLGGATPGEASGAMAPAQMGKQEALKQFTIDWTDRAKKGELDPFAVAVMAELGQDISGHKPMTFEELEDWEGLNFDLIITLSPEAHHKALELTRTMAADVEYWPTPDPTGMEGNREQKLSAYREVCDGLSMRIRRPFAK